LAAFTGALVWVACKTDQTLRDTLETNRLQTKASVYFRLAAWTDEIIPRTRMSIGNAGLTATKKLTYASGCIYSATKIFDPFESGREKMQGNAVSHYTLGPKTLDEGIPICAIGEAVSPAPEFIYVFGYATYDDTFTGKLRETQFCFRIDPPPGQRYRQPNRRIIGGPCEAGHNCTDDECQTQK